MDNETIARTFLELADVLELTGEVPFKVRAFRTAARAIEGLGESVAEKVASDTLQKIPGVGDGMVRRLKELVGTGKLAELDEQKKQLPPGLMELMNVPGMGIKTAQQVWKERGITNIDALEAAAKDGKLRDLPRFGEKREEKLVAAIAAWRKRASAPKRWPMAEALDLADALCARVRALPGVSQCQYAGSLRRRRETVGDLDILVEAEAEHAASITDAFASMPEVAEILGKGETKTTVVLAGGMQADLRVVPKESFGAALQYFTGSKDHNVAMRTIAVKRGLKVSEYGVFDAAGKSVAGETEEEVYGAIGLAWMPPELRENRGEIDAAKNGGLPKLVELSDLIGDLHMHTTETDGRSTLEQMVKAAEEAGREYVAITDHSESLTVARGMTRERLRAQVTRIRELEQKRGKLRVLCGIETDILADGSLDLEDELSSLDWVVGSVHSQLGMPREQMTRRVVRAIESGRIDCLGHPTSRMLGHRDASALDLDEVLKALVRTGVALELNASPMRLDIPENGAHAARELGIPIVIDSDAHNTRELGFLRYGVGIARRAWLGPEHVLTTRSAAKLAAWRQARIT
ncbi:MAG TPA: DNA polymerase/3'-5' exonuclease PolX [Polyangiaceae bacterium]|nr:DNA polymerase/3'-5' exonuclease PolX [Polyangiaceae bacterium]